MYDGHLLSSNVNHSTSNVIFLQSSDGTIYQWSLCLVLYKIWKFKHEVSVWNNDLFQAMAWDVTRILMPSRTSFVTKMTDLTLALPAMIKVCYENTIVKSVAICQIFWDIISKLKEEPKNWCELKFKQVKLFQME